MTTPLHSSLILNKLGHDSPGHQNLGGEAVGFEFGAIEIRVPVFNPLLLARGGYFLLAW
jgi:hypothetical protein